MVKYRCSKCGKKGHNAATCKKKKKKIVVRKSGTRKCSKCGKGGHNAATCKKKKRIVIRKSGARKCGKCGKTGHNIQTCTNKKKIVIRKKTPRRKTTRTTTGTTTTSRGQSRDLQTIFNKLNRQYFNNRLSASLRWSRRVLSSRWGYYQTRRNRITINLALKDSGCPYACLETTVYHEMLHEDIPVYRGPNGCRVIHGPEFKRREREHPDFEAGKQGLRRCRQPSAGGQGC